MTSRSEVVAVVGGGIAGLSAALALAEAGPAPHVVVLEAEERLGGKVRTGDFAGVPAEEGPDAFLARVPDAVDLCRRLGMEADLVAPATGRALLWSRGALRPLPAGLVLGVPTRFGPLARSGILSPAGLARATLDLVLPASHQGEPSVAQMISSRLGHEVHERLVSPLVGGINAGRSDRLGAAASVPQLWAAAAGSRSLVLGLRRAARDRPPPSGPVFLTHPRGLSAIMDRLAGELASLGVELRTGCAATGLERSGGGWRLRTEQGGLEAAGVVVATPAYGAADLLGPVAPEATALLRGIPYASVSLVTLAYPEAVFPRPLDASGYLVPEAEGRLTTACTWLTSKWGHLARPGQVLLRVSTGRFGDDRHLGMDDESLVRAAHGELVAAMGLRAGGPDRWRVVRWPRSFPQYGVGHLERMERLDGEVARLPGLALAGAAYRGIGIPACTAQGRRAAARVLQGLGRLPDPASSGGGG